MAAKKHEGETFYRISVQEAFGMHSDNDICFVDVRNQDEYESGHISGAKLIPVDDLLGRIDELPTDKKLFFICSETLKNEGFRGFFLSDHLAINTPLFRNI